jgi:glucose 1-dehydrogenase/3-oxoacyl-[acyl-carrier protein] reductase
MLQFEGKVAVVTGAGTGIGQGVALELGRRGAAVMLHYHSHQAGAQETAHAIEQAGGCAVVQQANLEQVQECFRLIETSLATLGRVDILVNNAGASTEALFLEVTPELWDKTIDLNLRAPYFCSQAAARAMITQGGGKIVHIGSIHGLVSSAIVGPYAAAKGGLHMLTRQMALALAPHHINVNCVAPGLIEVERYFIQYPEYERDQVAGSVPWGRVGFPDDIARAVAFLCSEEANFITGQVIFVDGGQTSAIAISGRPREPRPYPTQAQPAARTSQKQPA